MAWQDAITWLRLGGAELWHIAAPSSQNKKKTLSSFLSSFIILDFAGGRLVNQQ
jgi:hypothetical protein